MRFVLLTLTLLALNASSAQAQLFGQRDLGRPLSRQPRAVASIADANQDAGQVTGNERFIRGNRDRASFVGRDQMETQSFVGSQQASTDGVIVSSTAGIEPPPDRSSEINQAIEMPTKKKMYLPKIVLGSDFVSRQRNRIVGDRSTERVRRSVNLASKRPIEVLVVERTAILRGVVTSAMERRLAETLALFEPGISRVENQLQFPSSTLMPATVQPLQTLELPPDPSAGSSVLIP